MNTSVLLQVIMSLCNGNIGTMALAIAFPTGWLPSPLGELEGAILGNYQKRMWGCNESFLYFN